MVKVGIIGAGRIGRVHITSISTRVKDAVIKTVADPFLNDETDDDANVLMVELEEMTMVFYNKYAKYLSKDTIKKYLKQINILKNELNLYEYKKDILSSRRR